MTIRYGGAEFTSFHAGPSYLNIVAMPPERNWSWWGRVIFHVADVDSLSTDGHELCFAKPLA